MPPLETQHGRIGTLEQGKGPLVLFLHGVGSDKTAWKPQLAALSPRFRCVAVDYPGYSDSNPAPAGSDGAWLVDWVLGVLDGLGEKRAHLIGLSMGGVVALAVADRAPDRVLSITIADAFARHPDGAAINARFQDALTSKTMAEFAAARAPALVGPDCPPQVLDDIRRTMASLSPLAVAWASPIVWLADHSDRLAGLRCPTLVLVGSEDKATPPELSLGLAQAIPHAKLGIIGGAGHLSNLEKPEQFNRLLLEFLDRL